MKDGNIIKEFKANMLDLWILISNSNSGSCAYIQKFQNHLNMSFQIEEFVYYDIKHGLVSRSYNPSGQVSHHAFALAELMPYIEKRHVHPNPLLAKFKEYNPNMDEIITIEKSPKGIMGFLLFASTPAWDEFKQTSQMDEFVRVVAQTIDLATFRIASVLENQVNANLLEMTELFHSTMDIERILEAVITGVSRSFPNLEHHLILSNDHERKQSTKVYVFDYINERKSTIEAFVSGELVSEHAKDLNKTLLNVPIKGRQATYGVLQIIAPMNYEFSEKDKKIASFLGNTSGNSLENAKLYHQSHRLVSDLQLINESSHRLNMNLSEKEMLVYLSNLLHQSFKPSQIAFVYMNGEHITLKTGTSPYFNQVDAAIYLEYVHAHFSKTIDPLFVADFSELIQSKAQYCSLMAIPLIVTEKVFGFVLVLHESSYYFSFDSFKLMQSIIRHSSLAVSNVILREQLQEMVDRDHLTKLFARHYLGTYIEKSVEEDVEGIFALLDIDDFKLVNDRYGHQEGDRVLETVGAVMMECVGSRGISARWGGEELAIYLPNEKMSDAMVILQKIMSEVTERTEPKVTVSVGISSWKTGYLTNYKTLFKEADIALYYAKRHGKDQAVLYSKEMNENS